MYNYQKKNHPKYSIYSCTKSQPYYRGQWITNWWMP